MFINVLINESALYFWITPLATISSPHNVFQAQCQQNFCSGVCWGGLLSSRGPHATARCVYRVTCIAANHMSSKSDSDTDSPIECCHNKRSPAVAHFHLYYFIHPLNYYQANNKLLKYICIFQLEVWKFYWSS